MKVLTGGGTERERREHRDPTPTKEAPSGSNSGKESSLHRRGTTKEGHEKQIGIDKRVKG